MNAHTYRLDTESQVESHDREESRDAARFDRTTYRRIGGMWFDADRVPHESDVDE